MMSLIVTYRPGTNDYKVWDYHNPSFYVEGADQYVAVETLIYLLACGASDKDD